MPFVANTPESLLNRGDSKNPNSTCRGITSNGRPCRRALDKPPSHKHLRSPRTPDPRDESLYCWQHKDQASLSAHSSPGPRASATPILEQEEPRTSLDTLADRLGLVDLQEKQKYGNGRRRMDTRPPRPSKPLPPPEKQSTLSKLCCCFSMPIEDQPPAPRPPRPQPMPVQQRPSASPQNSPNGRRPSRPNNTNLSAASPAKSARSNKSTTSQTAQMKDLIPDTLDASTASALLNELARPYVDSEEEGYIYMFWLTPASSAAPVDAARSLLAPPSPNGRSRRASDAVSSFADSGRANNKAGKKTMLLKIGRAANVQRRMNQWQRQCGRDIEVLRFYPYSPSSASNGSSGHSNSGLAPGRKTPHAHRVERLIHIELAGMGLRVEGKKACEACGKEHREWFEIDATRDAVREVDGIIRRWVEMDEASVRK